MPVTGEDARRLWSRHVQGESWRDIGWYPPIAGHPHSGEVDPDQVQEAFGKLTVTEAAVLRVCPWPEPGMVDDAISDGHLIVVERDGLWRVVITPEAREALTREPLWAVPVRDDPGRVLAKEALRATQHATLVPFAAYLHTEYDGHVTALAMMRPQQRRRDVVLTLWSHVRDTALAVDREERGWALAEYEAGRDPYPSP